MAPRVTSSITSLRDLIVSSRHPHENHGAREKDSRACQTMDQGRIMLSSGQNMRRFLGNSPSASEPPMIDATTDQVARACRLYAGLWVRRANAPDAASIWSSNLPLGKHSASSQNASTHLPPTRATFP